MRDGERRPRVTFVIPAYNEEARLPDSLERVLAFAAQQPYDIEVIVSDDGSSDGTAEIVERAAGRGEPRNCALRLLRAPQNQGKGAAIRRGMLEARGEHVFFLDADLATPPDQAPQLLALLEAGADVAAGSRIQPDGTDMRASQPFARRAAGRAYTLLRKALGVLRDIDDTQCPLKGFRREAARAIFERQQLSGWSFDAEVLAIARSLGYRIETAPVQWRHVEGSRIRLRPSEGWQVVRDLFRLRRMHPVA